MAHRARETYSESDFIQAPRTTVLRDIEERRDRYRSDRRHGPSRRIIVDNEEGYHNIRGRDGRRDPSRVVIFDNEGGHYNIPGREREAEPTYANAQNTASKYYEGGFGDRAWRKKKLERIGRRHLPRTDPKREPPKSSK
jgi:hypothetical protein